MSRCARSGHHFSQLLFHQSFWLKWIILLTLSCLVRLKQWQNDTIKYKIEKNLEKSTWFADHSFKRTKIMLFGLTFAHNWCINVIFSCALNAFPTIIYVCVSHQREELTQRHPFYTMQTKHFTKYSAHQKATPHPYIQFNSSAFNFISNSAHIFISYICSSTNRIK